MITITDKSKCSGCSSCVNKCPEGCIKMVQDEEGFLYPKVNESMCIKCGLCEKACPYLSETNNDYKLNLPYVYAAYSKNNNIRMNSSSGGIFYHLAEYILKNKGIVFGAAREDVKTIKHRKAETIEELTLLMKSKYLPSIMGDTFAKAKSFLDDGRLILFSGTPCQIAGLYGYLGRHYENLYTVDVLCHGVPAPIAFEKWLKELEEESGKKVQEIFRDKHRGWLQTVWTIRFDDDTEISDVSGGKKFPFHAMFLKNAILRQCCTRCKFAGIPRISDISLGDYFKYKNIPDNKGLSIVTVNTARASELFNNISNEISYEICDANLAFIENEHLAKGPAQHKKRNRIFKNISKYDLETLFRKYIRPSLYDRGIKKLKKLLGI